MAKVVQWKFILPYESKVPVISFLRLSVHVKIRHFGLNKARFKRRTLHVPNLMQMRKIYCFRSFALDSAHEKFDV